VDVGGLDLPLLRGVWELFFLCLRHESSACTISKLDLCLDYDEKGSEKYLE
jgi:hypothetical protein